MCNDSSALFDVGCNLFYLRAESDTDSEFVLHEFTNYYLKDNATVIVLSLSQTFLHFSNIAKKLGMNLEQDGERRNFICFDVLKLLAKQFGSFDDIQKSEIEPTAEYTVLSPIIHSKRTMQPLFILIKETFQATNNERLVLIIDNISLFLSFGVSVPNLFNFIHYCGVFVKEKKGSMLICSQEIKGDGDNDQLNAILCHMCDRILSVRRLSTGHSQEMNGKICMYEKGNIKLESKKITNLYKVEDKSVKLFPE